MPQTPYFWAARHLQERGPESGQRERPGAAERKHQPHNTAISSRKRAELIRRGQENLGLDRATAERRVDQWLRGLGVVIKD